MKTTRILLSSAVFAAAMQAGAAHAGAPIKVGDGLTVTPLLDTRLRLEHVDEDNRRDNATAITLRLRPGIEVGTKIGLSVLVDGDFNLGLDNSFNSTTNGKTNFSVIPDPTNAELNRAQIKYKGKNFAITAGRQRIDLDDQRFVGSVAWRQNEQTLDAVRGEAMVGPVSIDATYSWKVHTIFGVDAGPRTAFDGENVLINAGVKAGPLMLKAFSYTVEQDEAGRRQFNSQTYGVRGMAAIPLSKTFKLNLTGSLATQADTKGSPVNYRASYYMGDATLATPTWSVGANYEVLGSDAGVFAFQTPLATLHKFQGWADLFLVTPNRGIRDFSVTATVKPKQTAIKGLNAQVTWHDFKSDVGSIDYGSEFNTQVGFSVRKVGVLLKYARYDAKSLGVNTTKFWFQLGWAY